jgi:transcriptional regulator with XRE-family HTH domain
VRVTGGSIMNGKLMYLLKEARKNKDLRQQDVANAVGFKSNALSNWENGRCEPDIDTFVELCKIYEVNCGDILASAYNLEKSSMSPHEIKVIQKYRKTPEMQDSIDKLLGIENDEKITDGISIEYDLVAKGGNNAKIMVNLSDEDVKNIKNRAESIKKNKENALIRRIENIQKNNGRS